MNVNEQWKAECSMRALRIISDLREGTMQPYEVSAEDWKHIRRVKREIAERERDERKTLKQLLPKG